MREVRND